jgi:hypothetical protein
VSWKPFDNGATIGKCGSENGVIVRDEEHELGARITLERGGEIAPFAITCGIYGWMFHTCFVRLEAEAATEYGRMQEALAAILNTIPPADDPDADAKCKGVADSIAAFVEQFP